MLGNNKEDIIEISSDDSDSWAIPDLDQIVNEFNNNPKEIETLWFQKYKPDVATLCVHKKKVQQVREWLQKAFSGHQQHKILCLTGPSGCGKTATIQSLSKELEFDIIEWTDPTNVSRLTNLASESLTHLFSDFLTMGTKHNSLSFAKYGFANFTTEDAHARKVLLVEDLPILTNHAFRTAIHDAISHVSNSSMSKIPLVFIVPEMKTTWEHDYSFEDVQAISMHQLIPSSVMNSGTFTHIS
jgi:cell cycle checkpoint protein